MRWATWRRDRIPGVDHQDVRPVLAHVVHELAVAVVEAAPVVRSADAAVAHPVHRPTL